jgi:NADH-quinone oxidoreductase subunit F
MPVSALRAAAERLLSRMIDLDGEPVQRLSVDLARGPEGAFWGPQVRVVTDSEPGRDPLDLDGYLADGGFKSLGRCLGEISPPQLIDLIFNSNLRGRGGAGFSTAAKWQDVADAPAAHRHLICNADEGDPGAFMDRMLLESYPFRVIEGMAIAGFAVGCDAGTFFVRSEYPLAIARLRRSIDALAARGFLGERVMGFPFSFRIDVVESPGAFVCGEETAMIAALEGRRGNPRARPPYPSRQGLWGRPTLVNNVETFATVPWIVAHGPAAFRAIGTKGSPGTKTFALAGKIVRGGLIEVPMGMSVRRIVQEIGGGVREGRTLKAVQIGGPSGGCLPAALADLPVDFESLRAAGAMMGSGGMVVLDDTDCMVDVARYFMAFSQQESCGKCTCCRVGTKRMLDILNRLCAGKGRANDLDALRALAFALREGSLCGLGRSAPNPVLTTLDHFHEEYEEHLEGYCRAGRCRALVAYTIGELCIGCTRCAQRCPGRAIQPAPFERHSIDESLCIRCDTCRQVCPAGAVSVVRKGKA